MSAFTLATTPVLRVANDGFQKKAVIAVVGTGSYDTGGSVLDLSSVASALASSDGVFTRVDGVTFLGFDAAGLAIGLLHVQYLRAALGAPATGKLLVTKTGTINDAEFTSTGDLSTATFFLEVIGA
jgi:hypothetical protein